MARNTVLIDEPTVVVCETCTRDMVIIETVAEEWTLLGCTSCGVRVRLIAVGDDYVDGHL